ncbi:hypothetical protein KY317_00230 [Candidatus Woesearchaeota archaeon]|nr:hypothetical protein [Candidatus Woesearchaeota archaeon]
MNLKILNKKQIKNIFSLIKNQFGADVKLEYIFLQDDDRNLFVINRDISRIDLSKLRVNSIGMYFGQVKETEIMLGIEASQTIGPFSKKNVVEVDKQTAKKWLAGEDLDYSGKLSRYVLIKSNNDFLGTGKIKEKKILNSIPKQRRLKTAEII